MCYGLKVALFEMFPVPIKNLLHNVILVRQGNIRYGSTIGVNTHGYTGIVYFIGGMIFYLIKYIYLNIAGWTNF